MFNSVNNINNQVVQKFKETVIVEDGVIDFGPLSLERGLPPIGDSLARRLVNQIKLMENKPEVMSAYDGEFRKQIERGVL